jgi:hypothetical protein
VVSIFPAGVHAFSLNINPSNDLSPPRAPWRELVYAVVVVLGISIAFHRPRQGKQAQEAGSKRDFCGDLTRGRQIRYNSPWGKGGGPATR